MEPEVELERENDSRWIAEVVDLPGVLVYGDTPERALSGARTLALRVLADKIKCGEVDSSVDRVGFRLPPRIPAA
jgi:predicted RNase H-like HicB family nuclease